MSTKKRDSKNASTSGVVVPSTERLRDLYTENAAVQRLRNENDLLERIIMDKDGVDLRAVVDKIGAHVQHTAREFNALHDRMQATLERRNETSVSQFMQKKLTDEDLRALEYMFSIALQGNPNDDKARIRQLAIVFTALTIELDVRQQLTAQPRHVDRFLEAGKEPSVQSAEDILAEQERAARERANLIQHSALYMFLEKDSRNLLTKYSECVINMNHYVEECVNRYLSYKHPVCPHVARQYYATTGVPN